MIQFDAEQGRDAKSEAEYIDRRSLLHRLPQDLPYKASVKRVLYQAPRANVAPVEETVKEFAKFLIDKAECGAIYIDDIVDLCDEFLEGEK